jgi:spore coat polysaccharide biosynthesis protein SpsF
VRICADNPFIDPDEVDRLVAFALDARADYAFNHLDRLSNHYAEGFGAEIVSRDVLDEVGRLASEARHREHVMTYVGDPPERFRILTFQAPADLAFPDLCFDVDTREDLERLQPLASRVGKGGRACDFVAAARAQS